MDFVRGATSRSSVEQTFAVAAAADGLVVVAPMTSRACPGSGAERNRMGPYHHCSSEVRITDVGLVDRPMADTGRSCEVGHYGITAADVLIGIACQRP